MSRQILIFILTLFALNAQSQNYTLSGKITDNELLEPLIGVTVMVGEQGVVSDFNGEYRIELPDGTYQVVYSYIGFEDVAETIVIVGAPLRKDIVMGGSSEMLNEIIVTADIAIDRETPVAFSNIPTLQIQEELAAQDIPMLLNSTPGAYATQSGGGDGDARITIRGFNQRNIAVMLDGIPVNDMQNGWVYWSNWFGLDVVTKTMQVQRGLGASKLSVPSVGGTINILTKGIDSRMGGRVEQTIGNNGFLQTKIGYTTGRLKSGWGISAAASYKRGNGWVDGAYTNGYFYYLRIDKSIGNHLFSLSGFGAPQQHGQRNNGSEVQFFDADFATRNGVPQEIAELGGDYGIRRNRFVGMLERFTINTEGDTLFSEAEEFNTRKNYYHKPQISFRHFWSPNERTSMSNVAYLSIGNGGGTATTGVGNLEDGSPNLQGIYNDNIAPDFPTGDKRSAGILQSSINNHFWVGTLSTFSQSLSDDFKLSGGLDLRYYDGKRYREVYDLLGGEFFRSEGNERINQSTTALTEGDRFDYDNNSYVAWAGLFSLLEYKKNGWSAFLNLSTSNTGYSREDHMLHKTLELDDQTFYVSYNIPTEYNGTLYTVDNPNPDDVADAIMRGLSVDSTSAQNQRLDWKWHPAFTIKTGAAYKINRSHSFFTNLGYLSRAPRYNNAVVRTFGVDVLNPVTEETGSLTKFIFAENAKSERTLAVEAGYSFRSEKFSANLNGYFTNWDNKPLDFVPTVFLDGEYVPVTVNGLSARHAGIELDFAIRPVQQITLEGLASLGNWIWASPGEIIQPDGAIETFDPTGVHVGDAAQTQFGAMVRFEPVEGLYFKLRGTYFGRNYANFDPITLTTPTESWRMPDYFLTDLHAGYNFKLDKTRFGIRFNVLNLFNTTYISDAENNEFGNTYDAQAASVFFGQGRRFNTSFQISF